MILSVSRSRERTVTTTHFPGPPSITKALFPPTAHSSNSLSSPLNPTISLVQSPDPPTSLLTPSASTLPLPTEAPAPNSLASPISDVPSPSPNSSPPSIPSKSLPLPPPSSSWNRSAGLQHMYGYLRQFNPSRLTEITETDLDTFHQILDGPLQTKKHSNTGRGRADEQMSAIEEKRAKKERHIGSTDREGDQGQGDRQSKQNQQGEENQDEENQGDFQAMSRLRKRERLEESDSSNEDKNDGNVKSTVEPRKKKKKYTSNSKNKSKMVHGTGSQSVTDTLQLPKELTEKLWYQMAVVYGCAL
jgi:hypothetical protein